MYPMTSLRDYKTLLYKYNPDYYSTYCAMLRDHQNKAIKAALNGLACILTGVIRGQIILPCGTGKTIIQICLHVLGMIEQTERNETGIYAIVSHRLGLNRQLCDELVDVMIRCGLLFDILCIGSDRDDSAKYYAKYAKLGYSPQVSNHLTSLVQTEIENFITNAKRLNRHVLVVSTYNSVDRLKNVGKIDLITYDEAHNIVRDDFTFNINLIKGNALREYYFTATRKTKRDEGGMDDKAFFGDILYSFIPRDAIAKGEIACPRIHVVRGRNHETANSANLTMLIKNTIEAFNAHKFRIKNDSFNHNEIGAKIIVGANGIEEMEKIYFGILKYCQDNVVHALAISSKSGYVNGTKVSNTEFFKALYALKDNEDALIFNVDMLGEGINLPSITGVMPLRNLGLIKLLQLFGRALRLHPLDRGRLYSGTLEPGDYKNYVKPYGHLVIPEHLTMISEHRDMKSIIRSVYNEYETPVEQMVIQDKYQDNRPEDGTPMTKQEDDDGKRYDLDHDILDIVSAISQQILEDKLANMSLQERIDYILLQAKQ